MAAVCIGIWGFGYPTAHAFFAVFVVFAKFIAVTPQYAGEDGHHAPGFKDAFVAYSMKKYPNASRQSLMDMNSAEKKKLAAGAPEEKEERVAVESAANEAAAARLMTPASLTNADDAATAAAAVLRKRAALAEQD